MTSAASASMLEIAVPQVSAVHAAPVRRRQVARARARVRLIAVSGPDVGQVFFCEAPSVVIGSGPGADIVLSDASVAPAQCVLRVSAEGAIRVLDQTGSVRINGVEVVDAVLHDGAMLAVGGTELRLASEPERIEIPPSTRDRLGAMVGHSLAMRRVFGVLERAARTDATVLLYGETGTGKELAADSVHRESRRADGPFVVVDCGAIPAHLLESELFGHERGAFTGAVQARRGAFEEANGGTIFLDEIGELSCELQPKLLRVLERRHIKRVGSNQYVPVDVRIVAATNRALEQQVQRGAFRQDLFYRLAVIEAHMPALRERRGDIPLLARTIASQLGASDDDFDRLFDDEWLDELSRHAWPGNVRELRNYLERCLALRQRMHLPEVTRQGDGEDEALDTHLPLKEARRRWSDSFEARYVATLLERHDQNVSAAAREAGVGRMYFYRLLWKHGLR